ncbi:MAG: response regulator [Deltaproteobacteria bacterium]|nr:response regulator [Deltaproteobacteria bacterium]
MNWSFIRYFSNRTMGFKLTIVFLSVILIPMLLLAYISYKVIDSRLTKEAEEKINMGLKSAWTEYYVRGDQMRYGMLQAASMEEIKRAISRGDKQYLRKMITRWKEMRPYVDIWIIVDENERVIARLNSDVSGDRLELNGSVKASLDSGEPRISSELIEKSILKLDGKRFLDEAATPETANQNPKAEKESAVIALMVVTPVLSDSQRPIGAIITGDVLNEDNYISETIANKIPGLFTTISVNGVRIASNLVDSSGRSIKGTAIPETVLPVVKAGKPVFGEWSMPGMTFISVFEPIRDAQGKIIGSLDVGISKEKLWEIQKETQKIIIIITILGLAVSLFAAVVSTSEITRPLKSLKEKIGEFARGDLQVRVNVDSVETRDELRMLARAFNSMMDGVSKREEEKERYLREIEEKNREFIELNEELKITNESLEVAYEETQSQTEELHAINEELKLLNEDLDRKNIELQRANRIITQEEEEIKSAKEKLRFIYDSITDYILLVDYGHRVLEANRHFMDKFRISESALTGEKIYKILGMEQPRNCPIKKSIHMLTPVEAEMTTQDGKVFTWHIYPSVNENEDPKRAVVYIKDITEQRMMTNKLMQTDKLSSLGELVSGVAHELNNPLTGIMCFSELLLDDKFPDDVKSKLKKINDASHRCKKIIDNLLTFARWKRPERKYEDINKVIKESIDLRGYQLKVDNIDLEVDLDESIPPTMLDDDQIHQVFLNLINNARDAIKEKGERGKIRISSRHCEGKIIVKFEDTGKGMSDEIANKIFDPFFTTKGVGKGTGLGLSISYGIINEHGGTIYASSTLGMGTVFVVELPVTGLIRTDTQEIREAFGFKIDPVKARIKGLKALILDDEPIVLDLLHDSLTYSGFKVEKTGSGDEALRKLKENDYDIIISDIKMPGLDGRGFYNEVKKIRPESQKKIIFISGDSLSKETQRFLKETGNLSLNKPFTVDQLHDMISRLIF